MNRQAVAERQLVGERMGHYLILEKIGAGGMGEVYRARDEHLAREVAIKVLPEGTLADEQSRDNFHREALTLSRLNHPTIATIYDFDRHEETDFLVTEYVPGTSLNEELLKGRMPEDDILLLSTQLVEGVAAAHGQGIVHRDLKPGNLRVMPDRRLKILDFGLAKPVAVLAPESPTESTVDAPAVAGTLLYMSPEQLRGEPADVRADIYSIGAVLYEMGTGRTPFESAHIANLVEAVLHKAPLPPTRLRPELSAHLEQIVLKCLEKEPAHRYQSALELLTDLRRAGRAATQEKSVAVLYFENLSGQREDEYFRDGITEDITTELSKIKELRVFSRSAVLVFRDKPVTPAQVGQQLNARYLLEGSLRRDADRLRITAKLVNTRSGHCVWAARYDRQLQDVFAIQDEIATNIAHELQVVLTETEKEAIAKVPTADVRAYDFYLRGRQFFHQFRRKGFDFAREMFARAIEIDPRYARAYAGIADCSAFLYFYWDSNKGNLEQADQASQRALEIDPNLAEAHASRGLTASMKKDYVEAEREFRVAMQLGPRLFEPYYFFARNCYAQGKLQDAVAWFEQASKVSPEDYQAPMLLASALNGLGLKSEAQAAYRRGLGAAERHLEFHPGDSRALYFGANALSQLKERERSMEWAERALALEGEEPQVLYNVACVYALLGEFDKAIDCLEKSITHGWGQREWMEHDPDLAPVREHPRFRALMQAPRI
ncbi:MAG: protein kinase [Acidobacteriia bacterium]|nr:protein kinase [Terriglobia bacterium]